MIVCKQISVRLMGGTWMCRLKQEMNDHRKVAIELLFDIFESRRQLWIFIKIKHTLNSDDLTHIIYELVQQCYQTNKLANNFYSITTQSLWHVKVCDIWTNTFFRIMSTIRNQWLNRLLDTNCLHFLLHFASLFSSIFFNFSSFFSNKICTTP